MTPYGDIWSVTGEQCCAVRRHMVGKELNECGSVLSVDNQGIIDVPVNSDRSLVSQRSRLLYYYYITYMYHSLFSHNTFCIYYAQRKTHYYA